MAKKASSLSGFPEWLPQQRLVERHVLDTLRTIFELHGFSEIETRAVEPVEQLLSKGETSKEIYLLQRLQAREDQRGSEATLGLHFDLTVPLARYVVENAGQLVFPFRRYQIQKVWRGERPQDGRFREFIQADIDVIGDGDLPFHYEIELPLVMAECLAALPIPPATVLVNNRKLSQGFYEAIGITAIDDVLHAVDKLDKIGPEAVTKILVDDAVATPEQAELILKLASIYGGPEVIDRVRELGVTSELLEQGLSELGTLLERAEVLRPGAVKADLKIARGLDYYTGSVYETVLEGHEELGSICSGGRYDKLASDGKRTYPGVGLSIGVSRLVARMLSQHMAEASRPVPTCVLVAVNDESERLRSDLIAAALRERGISADTSATAAKFGKQIRYADRRGIPFVWFPAMPGEDGTVGADQVKDIRSGEQFDADPATWEPPAEDLRPLVRAVENAD